MKKLNPRFAGDEDRRKIMIAILQAFRDDYDGARTAYRGGNHAVVFPHGTWKMRQVFNVRVADPPVRRRASRRTGIEPVA